MKEINCLVIPYPIPVRGKKKLPNKGIESSEQVAGGYQEGEFEAKRNSQIRELKVFIISTIWHIKHLGGRKKLPDKGIEIEYRNHLTLYILPLRSKEKLPNKGIESFIYRENLTHLLLLGMIMF